MAFAATNVDDLFLLIALFAAARFRARDIVLGQFAGIGALYAASVAAALLAFAIAPEYLRWLGLAPVALGVRMLLAGNTVPGEEAPPHGGWLAVAAVTVADGADNLSVYIPLFATSSAEALSVYGTVFAMMTGLWCLAARWLVRHPGAGTPLRRWGPGVVPYVLIVIGLWILLR